MRTVSSVRNSKIRPSGPDTITRAEITAAVWFTRLDTPKPGRYHFRFRSQREPTPRVICLNRSRIN